MKSEKGMKIPEVKKKIEFRVKINFWRVTLFFIFLFLFLPFIVSLIEIGKTSTNVDISQALNDVKEGKISEVLVQNEKLVLKYVDGSTRFSVKESTESFPNFCQGKVLNLLRLSIKLLINRSPRL